jgi:hypothetical protein
MDLILKGVNKMKHFSLIIIFCFLFIIGCESTKEVFSQSPSFMSGDKKMVGLEGNIAIFGPDMIEGQTKKMMWHFWGTKEELGQGMKIIKPFRVEAINLKTNKKVKALVLSPDNNTKEMVWEYDVSPEGPNNGADAHIPSNMELPSSGLWKLDAYLGGKLKGSIIVDVKEK